MTPGPSAPAPERAGRTLAVSVIIACIVLAWPLYIAFLVLMWTVPTMIAWFLFPATLIVLALVAVVRVFRRRGHGVWGWRLVALIALASAVGLLSIPSIASAQWAASVRGESAGSIAPDRPGIMER